MKHNDVEIRILEPGDEAALEAFLLPHLASSMFLMGNARAAGLADTGDRYTGTYAAAFAEGGLVAVVAHFYNGVLMPQVPGSPALLDRLWRAAVTASGREVRGVIGPDDQACEIKAAAGLAPEALQLDAREKLYRLSLADLKVPAALTAGELNARLIVAADIDLLTEWRVAYQVETLGSDATPELRAEVREGFRRGIDERDTWLLLDDGKPVAMTAFNARIAEAVQVGGVYTPPALRSRGYGRCAVAASLLDARAEGAELAILFTAEENTPAQRAYRALGFEHIRDFRLTLCR